MIDPNAAMQGLMQDRPLLISSLIEHANAMHPGWADTPGLAETLPGYASEGLIAFFAPAKTPQAIITRMNQEAGRALRLLRGGDAARGI